MKRLMTICLLATACLLGVSAQGIYGISVKDDGGNDVSLIKWNFTKFLVGRDGTVLQRYEPTDKMETIDAAIQAALTGAAAGCCAAEEKPATKSCCSE